MPALLLVNKAVSAMDYERGSVHPAGDMIPGPHFVQKMYFLLFHIYGISKGQSVQIHSKMQHIHIAEAAVTV